MDIPSANCLFLLSLLGKECFGFLGTLFTQGLFSILFSEGAGIASVCNSKEKAFSCAFLCWSGTFL